MTFPQMSTPERPVSYLSAPARVSMADSWYELANPDHFWMRRRFQVMQHMVSDIIMRNSLPIAEIGCGNGVLQRQIEDAYGLPVTGFDLNESALKQNVSRLSPLYCYDLLHRRPEFHRRFHILFLFDVLEHIADEDGFLDALLFHLAADGHLVINLPAAEWLFSAYDRAAGHQRRYSMQSLHAVAQRNSLEIVRFTYWGLPMIPLLLLRKLSIRGQPEQEIIASGFDARSRFLNQSLFLYSQCERLPQLLAGTSVLAVLRRR